MNGPNDTRSSTHPSRPGRAQITPGDEAAVVAQWQRVVDVLEDAARACDARAELHNEPPEGPEFDRWISRFDGEAVRSAADQLRFAAPASLPVSFPDRIIGPAGRAASPAWADGRHRSATAAGAGLGAAGAPARRPRQRPPAGGHLRGG